MCCNIEVVNKEHQIKVTSHDDDDDDEIRVKSQTIKSTLHFSSKSLADRQICPVNVFEAIWGKSCVLSAG